MNKVVAIAKYEILQIARNRFSIVALGALLLAILVSILVASMEFSVKADAFKAYADALIASGKQPQDPGTQLFPLQLTRGGIEYLEIIGALFAIVIGYSSIAREKQRGTMWLIFTRPVSSSDLYLGKLAALSVLWFAFSFIAMGLSLVTAVAAGHAQISGLEMAKTLVVVFAAWVYLTLWSALAIGLASIFKNAASALVVAIALWLLVVLVIPQVGDTMDPDNQVPGGLFKSLQIAKPDETAVLANFSGYNNARDALEVSSVTKHFERVAFGFLGIKDKYNQQSFCFVWNGLLANTISLYIFALGTIAFGYFTTKPKTLIRTSK